MSAAKNKTRTAAPFLAAILSAILFFALSAFSAPVSFETAENTARKHLERKRGGGGVEKIKRGLARKAMASTPYFVFEKESGGFVIVSADDAAAPILGETDEGAFDKKSMPPALVWLLGTYERQIEEAVKSGAAQSGETRALWKQSAQSSNAAASYPKQLLATAWDQKEPYNSQVPLDGDSRSAAGCVAVVMAQIMNYWKHPVSGTGASEEYYTATKDIFVPSVNFNTSYDYADMLNNYPAASGGTAAQRDAVAKLIYHSGASVKMDYTQIESVAYPTDATAAFTKYFGYDNSIRNIRYMLSSISASDWKDLIIGQIENNSPVYYGGKNVIDGGAHAFIIDGYDNSTDMFHINWGWGGSYDGFFALTAFNPTGSNQYNDDQGMVINIMPNQNGNPPSQVKAAEFDVSVTQTAINANIRAKMNYGADFSGKIGYAVITDGAVGRVLDSTDCSISNSYIGTLGIYTVQYKNAVFRKTFSADMPFGDLTLQVVTKRGVGAWTPVGEKRFVSVNVDRDRIASIAWYGDNPSAGSFTITTAEQLAGLSLLVNDGNDMSGKTIALGANITLNDTTNWKNWKSTPPARSWTAIGSSANRQFRGVFDGAGFTVSGIYINTSNPYQGLFGYAGSGGAIKNLGVTASYVKGGDYVGGLVGRDSSCTITNSYAVGDVFGSSYIGGLVGYQSGTITNGYVVGDVSGSSYVGGLAGCQSGTVMNSYTVGDVSGTAYYVGGLAGVLYSGTIMNSYAAGKIFGNSDAGGLVGYRYLGVVISSYYDSVTAGAGGNGIPNTTAEMQSQRFVDILNIVASSLSANKWVYSAGGYPKLGGDTATLSDTPNSAVAYFDSGDGTEDNPYMIKTARHLENLSVLVSAGATFSGRYFKLSNDIAINDTANWRSWGSAPPVRQWTAIGLSSGRSFRGVFDGAGFTVSGIYINTSDVLQGLFGYVGSGGIIKNIGVTASYVNGDECVGGLAGVIVSGTITNSYAVGYVSGTGRGVGGLVGAQSSGTITNSYAAGDVYGTGRDVGGLVGEVLSSGTINKSYASVNVTGTGSRSEVGGLVGYFQEGSVTNSYTIGNVKGTGDNSDVGGLVGYNSSGIITNSYAVGDVYGTGRYVGGLVGASSSGSKITTSYYNSETSGAGSYGTPKTTAEMKLRSTYIDWDFDDVWAIDTINQGYPYIESLRNPVMPLSPPMPPPSLPLRPQPPPPPPPPVALASPDRAIPPVNPPKEAAVATPAAALTAEFAAGPNPAGKSSGSGAVNFFRGGARIISASLSVYDAFGKSVSKVRINDDAPGAQSTRRVVGSWNLTDAKGRQVPEGTYLIKGVIKTPNGKREKVSMLLGIRR